MSGGFAPTPSLRWHRTTRAPRPLARHRRSSTQVHLKSFTRAASGKIDDHVWIEKLDLRTHLQAPPSAPEGIDLLGLL